MSRVPTPKNCDESVKKAIQRLDAKVGHVSKYNFTASRLISTDSNQEFSSVTNLTSWIAGTTNQITVTDDTDGTVTLSTPQDIATSSSPTFAGGTFTGTVTGIDPVVSTDLATKEYVDLSVGSVLDCFLSNTASGVGSAYLMYTVETGEAQSTLNSSALGQGDDQLIFSFLTESGQPALTYLREGVYTISVHLNNATGNKATTVYATISYVDSDGSSNETLVTTSAETSTLTNLDTHYVIFAALGSDTNIDTTKRVLVKFYANVGTSGTDSTVTITMEGSTDSHIALNTSSEIYQRQDDFLDDIGALTDPGTDRILFWDDSESKLDWLSVGNSIAITTTTLDTIQDIRTSASPTFANLSLGTGELTCGSINRAADTLTLEINGTAELSLTSTTATFGGNIIIPDSGTIGSASDTDVMTISSAGVTTFSVFPVTPSSAPTTDYQVANKKYVDDNGGGGFTSKCSVYQSTLQSVATSTMTLIQLQTESYDSDSEFDNATNYRFTAGSSGYYHVSGSVGFGSLGDGNFFEIAFYKNGGLATDAGIFIGGSGNQRVLVSRDFYLAAADYIDMRAAHTYGANRNTTAGAVYTFLTIHRFA